MSIATLLVTGYIAWQQWQTAKSKFRLDLFDRRFPVFEAAMKLVLNSQKGKISDEAHWEFFFATRGVEFLFNRKIQDYCDTLVKKVLELRVGYVEKDFPISDDPVDDADRKKIILEWREQVKWVEQQAYEIPKLFGPFLRVRG